MISRAVDLRDAEAALLALVGAGAAYAIALDWRVALTAGFGVLVVRIGAGRAATRDPQDLRRPLA